MKNHTYSMIKEVPLLLKNLCQKHRNLGFGSFVNLNHFNYWYKLKKHENGTKIHMEFHCRYEGI